MNKRIKELMMALSELEGTKTESLSGCLLRAIKLVELCPWLDEVTNTYAKPKTQTREPKRKKKSQSIKVATGTEAKSQEGGART